MCSSDLAVKAYYGSIGTFLGPRSPGTAYVLLHHLMGDLGEIGRASCRERV